MDVLLKKEMEASYLIIKTKSVGQSGHPWN
jgi:hypothetical protein